MSQEKTIDTPYWSFTVVVEPDSEDGGYVVHCPALKGCWSQGETVDEALRNIVDAISGWRNVISKPLSGLVGASLASPAVITS